MSSRIDKRLVKGMRRVARRWSGNYNKAQFQEQLQNRLIVHACHHRVGTVWFLQILSEIAALFQLNFLIGDQGELKRNTEIFQQPRSHLIVSQLPEFRGSHIIRDPRDLVVSSYFYHLWTKENWAHHPQPHYDGLSYQQHIRTLDQNGGLMTEIPRARNIIMQMAGWDYENPHFLEVRYESLIAEEESVFKEIFNHYGIEGALLEQCLEIVARFSFQRVTGRTVGTKKNGTHMRSGRPGDWRHYFSPEHIQEFKNLYGDVLIKLKYEKDLAW